MTGERKETRPGKYGRLLALWVNDTINNLFEDEGMKAVYRERLIDKLRRYLLEPGNDARELEGLTEENFDLREPEHLARLIKEGIHLMYQKETASYCLEALIANL